MIYKDDSHKLAVYTAFNEATNYCPTTGVCTWRPTLSNRRVSGAKIGASKATGGGLFYHFHSTSGGRFQVKLHHAAWLRTYGELPAQCIDHINCNPMDNSIANLRSVTHADNYHNCPPQINNTSGIPGVCWDKSRNTWLVSVVKGGKNVYVGRYRNLLDAAYAVFNKRLALGYTMRPGF